jgi:hypothetical protein
MSEKDHVVSVPEVLRRVHEELVDLERAMETLHPLVDLVTSKVGSKDPQHLKAMQGIDHMEQMLMGLATYLSSLSEEAPQEWHIDTANAVSQITLGDLARRLRRQDEAKEDTDGDLEMFG